MAFQLSDIPRTDKKQEDEPIIPPIIDLNTPPPPQDLPTVTGIPQSSAPPAAITESFGARPWDDEERQHTESLNQWYREGQDNLDRAVFDPEKTFEGVDLGFDADPESARRSLIGESWLELNQEEPLAPDDLQRRVQIQAASLRKFGQMVDNDDDLYPLIQKDATKRKDVKQLGRDLTVAAYDDAMLPSDQTGGYAAFREKLKSHAGYDPEREADYLEAWHETRRTAKERVDAFREPLVTVWRAFKLDGNVTAAAMDAYAKLNPEQRPEFMDALAIRAKALPEEERKTFWGNMGKQTEQAFADYGRQAVESAGAVALRVPSDIEGFSVGGDELKKQGRQESQLRRNFAADVRKIAREDYDPLKSAFGEGKPGFWEGVAYQVPGVTGTSLTMAVPVVGMATMGFAMEGQAYEQMRGRMLAAGKTDEESTAIAEGLAPFIAAPQVALEKIGFAIWSRKLPGFSKVLDTLGDKISNRLLRGGMKVGTIATAETAIELVQDSLVYTVQDITAALTDDVPDVDWGKELSGTWAQAPEIFATMLPLALLGAAGGLSQESRNAAFARATPTELQALGIDTDGIAAISAANGPASLATAVDAAMAARDPNSETAQLATEELKKQLASQRQSRTALERLGYSAPSMVQHADGITVFSGEGEELGTAPDLSGAVRIARAHTVALDDMQADQVAALGSLMEAARAAVELDPKSVVDVSLGEFDPDQASPEMAARFAAQVSLKEQAEGGTGDIARSVLGYSVTEMAQGVRSTVNRLFKGAAVTDVFHETFHGLRRQALAAGTITRADEIAVLRGLDTILAGKMTKDGTQLRFIPENMQDDQVSETLLDEAFSEIAEMEILRTRKGEGKGKLGITRGVISRNLTALSNLMPGVMGKWTAFMQAVRARWGLSLSRAIAMKKAERDGTFDKTSYEAHLDKLLGLDQQTEHDAGVQDEFTRMMGGHEVEMPDDIPFSIGRVQLPPTTQKSRAIADPAPDPHVGGEGVSSLSLIRDIPTLVGKEADGEIDTSFSLGRARENYEKASNKVLYAKKELQEVERSASSARYKWQSEHGIEVVDPYPRSPKGPRSTGFMAGNKYNKPQGTFGNPTLEDWQNHLNLPEDSTPQQIVDGVIKKVGTEWFGFQGSQGSIKAVQLISATGQLIAEVPGTNFRPFPEPADLIAARESLAQAEADLYLAEEEFDPETDARLADAKKIRTRELSKQAAAFAALLDARDEEIRNAASYFVSKVWNAYGLHDELFQFGKTTSKSAGDIAAAVSMPGRLITASESGDSIRFSSNEGHLSVVDADTDRPYVAASQAGSKGKKGGGGSQLYVAALDWIHNNGKRIKSDPAGLTAINAVRRTSNFFASAIRHGTTKHLKPHASQKVGKWTKNDVLNTALLASKEMENVHKAIPETRGWTFDFTSGSFLAANGSEIPQADIAEVVAATNPGSSGIGLSTIQRAIITASAINEFQRGTSESLVESAESDLPGELRGVSYSLGPAKVAGILSDNALSRITDPRRRTHVMSRIARDFNAMRLQIERITSLSGIRRSKGDLRREAMAREDLRAEELIADVHRRFGEIMADEDLVKIKSQQVHAYLSDPSTPLRGKLMSKAQAIKNHPDQYQLHREGHYDGSDNVSRSVFGGSWHPADAAQNLYDEHLIFEPTADAMWKALLGEQNMVASMKELLAQATEEIRQAKRDAKQEANEWLATQSKDQEVNFSDKEEIRRSLRMLDAILLALPAEIRGKIGGYTQISMIATDDARLAYLKDKLAKADKELENFLRVEYAKEWEALLEKAAPKTNEAGQRPTGSIAADAYDVFRVAEWAMGQPFAVGEAEADKWDAIADHPDTEIPDADLARVKAQMIRLTTNWPAADAARREQAVLEGDKIYFGGLRALAIENSRRRERIGKLRDSAITGTGKTGARMEREAAKQAETGKVGELNALRWEFLSFGQLVNVLFGEKSAAAQWFNAREIAASNAAYDGFQAKANSLESLFDTLSGNRFDGEKLRHRMATVQTIKATDALGVEQTFSDSQAITFLLMHRQEDGKRHLQGIIDERTGKVISEWGWDDAAAVSIESQLSREGKAVMAFLGTSYGEEYGRINEVFRRIWNVSMPRHKMYAPLSVNPVQGKADSIMDPVSGDTMGAGMTPGSLKNRSFSAIAEPEFKDAFQVYLQHARQMEHFIAYGEFSRDALGVINRRETRSAILAAGGPAAAGTLSKWVDYFALGGLHDANMGSAWTKVLGGMLGRISQAALVGRVSVLCMQSLQLGAAAFKMPVGSFLTRLAKLSAGRLGWGGAIRSEYIQRRINQMPPLVRDMMQGMASGTPNRAKFLAGQLGQTITGADGLFTAGTYAIFYDYHLKLAKQAGDANPEATAHREAERLTDQVAQPTRTGARSWLEVANQGNPAFRAAWNFSSDPRQKMSLLLYEFMRRDVTGGDKAAAVGKSVALVWIVGGVLATLMRAMIRDLRNDDDDEIFDERYWNPYRLALSAGMGPFGAVPFLGGMLEDSTYKATGQMMPQGGMLSFLNEAAALPRKWSNGEVEPIKDLETLATAGAGFSGTSAAAASGMHLIRDLVGFIENLEGPD